MLLDETASLRCKRYTLAIALTGQAVCDPNGEDENLRSRLLAPALAEYQRALDTCSAKGIVQDAIRDLELVRAAGIEGLKPVSALLEGVIG